MKKRYLMAFALAATSMAQATTFKVTITNGSGMGLSPGVLYTTTTPGTDREIGALASEGFKGICNGGNAPARSVELSKDMKTRTNLVTEGIAPGETKVFMVKVKSPYRETLHFETMYGRSKDICGVFDVSALKLRSAQRDRHLVLNGRDDVVRTGAYAVPKLPLDTGDICREGSATACLRSFSPELTPAGGVAFFRPYLPSVLGFLTERFGADEVDSLLIPTGGAIHFTIQRH